MKLSLKRMAVRAAELVVTVFVVTVALETTMFMMMIPQDQKRHRIKELEAENERLKWERDNG